MLVQDNGTLNMHRREAHPHELIATFLTRAEKLALGSVHARMEQKEAGSIRSAVELDQRRVMEFEGVLQFCLVHSQQV